MNEGTNVTLVTFVFVWKHKLTDTRAIVLATFKS